MKYTVNGIQQEALINNGLDTADALILSWLIDFYHSSKMKKVVNEGEEYFWVNYDYLMKQLPVLGINTANNMGRRFKKYVKAGIMKQYLMKAGGTWTYYRFVPDKYEELKPPAPEVVTPAPKGVYHPPAGESDTRPKRRTKDSSINDSSIIDSKDMALDAPDWKKLMHKKIKEHFEVFSEKLGCQYYHSAKEAGSIKNIIQRSLSMAGDDEQKAESIIHDKLKILFQKIREPDSPFWADKAYCPSVLVSNWNNLNQGRPVKNKKAQGLANTINSIRGKSGD